MDFESRLRRDAIISSILVGPCPRCGGNNTHDCEAQGFDFIKEDEIGKVGSDCPVAKKVDDITIGHCDDCNYLWCLACLREKKHESSICNHFEICDECCSDNGYLTLDEFDEMDCTDCSEWDATNGCTLIITCPKLCPYAGDISACPTL